MRRPSGGFPLGGSIALGQRMAARLAWQAQVVAQGLAGQRALVATARLQRWNHELDEVVEALPQHRKAEDETIGRALVDPADDLVGDALAGAHELRARRGDFERHL